MRKEKFPRKKPIARYNRQITSPYVLVVKDNEKLGVLPIRQAQKLAGEHGLDLVEISSNARPPVCSIVDYEKWAYENEKQKKRKKQKKVSMKEIRMTPSIDKHDLDTKISNIRKFLQSGHVVLVSVLYKGRQNAHIDEGKKIILNIIELLQDVGKPEGKPNFQGKRMSVRIIPSKEKE